MRGSVARSQSYRLALDVRNRPGSRLGRYHWSLLCDLAGEVFPTSIRGIGAGVAAAVGKIGAVSTGFLFPILLTSIGTTSVLYILVVTSLIGAVVTWIFRIETNGVNLDEIGRKESAAALEKRAVTVQVSGNGSR